MKEERSASYTELATELGFTYRQLSGGSHHQLITPGGGLINRWGTDAVLLQKFKDCPVCLQLPTYWRQGAKKSAAKVPYLRFVRLVREAAQRVIWDVIEQTTDNQQETTMPTAEFMQQCKEVGIECDLRGDTWSFKSERGRMYWDRPAAFVFWYTPGSEDPTQRRGNVGPARFRDLLKRELGPLETRAEAADQPDMPYDPPTETVDCDASQPEDRPPRRKVRDLIDLTCEQLGLTRRPAHAEAAQVFTGSTPARVVWDPFCQTAHLDEGDGGYQRFDDVTSESLPGLLRRVWAGDAAEEPETPRAPVSDFAGELIDLAQRMNDCVVEQCKANRG